MKRMMVWTIVLTMAAAGLASCQEEKSELVVPPPPLPRYLSRDLAPEKSPAQAPGEADTSQAPASQAPTSAPAEAAGETAAPATGTKPSREEIARQIRDLDQVLAKVNREEAQAQAAPLAPNEAPPIRPGESPVKVSVQVPMEGSQPAVRTADAASGARRSGDVALTKITAVSPPPAAPSVGPTPIAPAPSGEAQAPGAALPSNPLGPPEPSAATPAATPEAPAAVTLEALVRRYEQLAAARPDDVEVARTLRVLEVLAGQDAKGLEAIPGLTADEQAVWRGLMWVLISARERPAGPAGAAQAGSLLDAVNDVRDTLRRQAPLELGDVRFYQAIKGYGDYVPVTANRFRPGDMVHLYSEIRNFATEKGEDGLYRVRLNERLILETPDGKSVWQQSYPNIEDQCRQARQDFYLTTRFIVPPETPPGKYVLKATIEDAATHKAAGARLELEVAREPAAP